MRPVTLLSVTWMALLMLGLLVSEAGALENPLHKARQEILRGRYDEAERLLQDKRIEAVERMSLLGLVYLQKGRHKLASLYFERVLRDRPTKTAVWLYLGQARYAMGRKEKALQALKRGRAVGVKLPGYFVIKARTESDLGREAIAFHSLSEARARFPADPLVLREMALLLVRMGLFVTALQVGRDYLAVAESDPAAYLVLGEALREAGQWERSAVLLQEAMLRFPDDRQVPVRLAYAYAAGGRHLTAARLFETTAARDASFHYDAAEQYRAAGRVRDALRCNGQVPEQDEQLKQRLAVFLGAERYHAAAALWTRLQSSGVMDDAILYQVAYAMLRSGLLEESERLVADVRDPQLKDSARKLESAIEACRRNVRSCR